ncbi:MAG TPA: hypothetical protein VGE37_08765 [Archangium sp.]
MNNTKKVRLAVSERAQGSCEAIGCGRWIGLQGEDGQLDHAFGRAKYAETPASCWLLCPHCHTEKTLNRPTAAAWLRCFIAHCELYGFTAERELALTKLSTLTAKGRAA